MRRVKPWRFRQPHARHPRCGGGGDIKISSLHNFCPMPVGVTHAAPNLYEFSAKKLHERELAVRFTLKTFEFASRVKAPVVVLHLGSMDLKDYTGRLREMLERDGKKSSRFEKLHAKPLLNSKPKREKASNESTKRCAKFCPKPKSAV